MSAAPLRSSVDPGALLAPLWGVLALLVTCLARQVLTHLGRAERDLGPAGRDAVIPRLPRLLPALPVVAFHFLTHVTGIPTGSRP